MKHKYAVRRAAPERDQLSTLIASGSATARQLMHARILLKADEGPEGPAWTDEAIAQAVEVSQPTVFRVRRPYVERGLEAALHRRTSPRTYVRAQAGWGARSPVDCRSLRHAPSAARPQPGRRAGACASSPISWSSWRSPRRFPTRPCAAC